MTLKQGDRIRIAVSGGRDGSVPQYYPADGTIGTVLEAMVVSSHTGGSILAKAQFPKGSTPYSDDIIFVPECDFEKIEE